MTAPNVVIAVRGGGKSRLADLLDAAEREALVAAMLEDMLDRLAGWRLHVLTPTAALADLARRAGAGVIGDAGTGLNPAFEAARAALAEWEPDAAFVALPGDLPLASAADLDAMLAALRPGRAVIAPAARGAGTGAVMLPPELPFRFAFGADSLDTHKAANVVLPVPGLALDIDARADVEAFLAGGETGRTRSLLSSVLMVRQLSACIGGADR